MKRIKVLFLIPSFGVGGLESHLVKQLPYFDTATFEIHIAGLFFYSGRPTILHKIPPNVAAHKISFLQWYNPLSWIRLFRILHQVKPDIVFGSMFSGNVAAVVGSVFFGYKVVTREHNVYSEKSRLQIFIDKISVSRASATIAVSSGVASFFAHQINVPENKIVVIENGINVDEIAKKRKELSETNLKKVRAEFNLQEDEKILLNVSRLKKQKRHLMMIDAYEIYRKLGGTRRLFIVGEGSERALVQAYIDEKKLTDVITLTGHRSDVDLFYSMAQSFVLTSDREGFANVVLESLAFGVPVVSTRVPGSVDVIKNGVNGFLVSDNREEIAQRLKELDTTEHSLGDRCVESVRAYDLGVNVKKYSDLILSLVEKRHDIKNI